MYLVQRRGHDGTWRGVVGSAGNRSYARGWYDAVTSYLPRPAYRFAREDGTVIAEDHERGAPRPAGVSR